MIAWGQKITNREILLLGEHYYTLLFLLRPISQFTACKIMTSYCVCSVQSIAKGLFQCKIQVDGEDCTEIGSSYVLAKNKCAQKVVESLSKKSENKRT